MLLDENNLKAICFGKTKNDWLSAQTSFPDFLSEVSKEEQIKNENSIQAVTEDFQLLVKNYSRRPFGKKRWRHRTEKLIKDFLHNETILGVHRSMKQGTLDAFWAEIKSFLRHARQFAPELSMEDIGQAIRNYIVYTMFNELHQNNPGFNPANFGYSMLYPFTDNYIDNEARTSQEKTTYNQMIRDKIQGKEVNPANLHHRKTCELLQMINDNTPEERAKEAAVLLLMMLDAQQNSLRQQSRSAPLSMEERLDISLLKGGISVLIDRFFVNKELTQDDIRFYLGFGFFLQLADDLQDIGEDSRLGYQTLFTVDLSFEQEERLVNQLFHYISQITADYHSENEGFKQFVLTNCYMLLLISVDRSKEFFSLDYRTRLERFFPVKYNFLEIWKKNWIAGTHALTEEKSLQILDEIIR